MFGKKKKIFARFLAGALIASLMLAGCGKEDNQGIFGEAGGKSPGKNAGETTGAKADRDPNVTSLAKGRYAEQEIHFDENSSMPYPVGIYRQDESLYLLDANGFDARVTLSGYSWEEGDEPYVANIKRDSLPAPLYERLKKGGYYSDMIMAGNGARMYTCFEKDETDDNNYYYDKYFLSADGTETPWNADGAVSRKASADYSCGDDGCFYVLVRDGMGDNGKAYRVDSGSGETKYLRDFSELDDVAYDIRVFRGRMYVTTYSGLHIFDLETLEELEEDKVLTELLGNSFLDSNGGNSYGFLLCPGADDSVYVVTRKGLYRHVLYGSVSELLIDGALTSLGDITNHFTDLYVDEQGENGMPVFYILYDTAKLVRLAYDPKLPNSPEKTIVLYSLLESDDIRQTVNSYQALHPEIYVRYEIGMSGKDGTTRQDALNALATRIAAGEGPDIFLLDDLPYNSYVEKGVLLDMSGIYGKLKTEEEYFDKVISALYRGDKLYTIPMMFAVPILVGDKGTLAGIRDMESLVRTVENTPVAEDVMRIGFGDAATTLRCMSYAGSGRWLKGDGSLDKDALAQFLRLCKRIYEADAADCSAEKLESLKAYLYDFGTEYVSKQQYRYAGRLGTQALDMVLYGNPFCVGLMSGNISVEFNYNYAVIEEAKSGYMVMPGDGKTALPFAMLGINAATPIPAEAEDFVRYALTDYLRESKYMTGIPINRGALLEMERDNPNKEENQVSSYAIGFLDEEEEYDVICIDAPWREMDVYEEYNAMLDSLDSVNICEYELMSAVLENGVPALAGDKTIEETVDAIAKRVQIYLAE